MVQLIMVSEPAKLSHVICKPMPALIDGMATESSGSGQTALGAFLGAVVGLLLFIVPGATLLGGAVAGYIGGGSTRHAVITGAIAGVLMYLPTATIVIGFGDVLVPGQLFAGGPLLLVLLAMALYSIALAAIGGAVGGYLARPSTRAQLSAGARSSDSPIWHGVIGGVVAVVLSFIPYSTVLGGLVAGYLEGGTLRDGAIVGTIAGLVALIPLMFIAIFVIGVFGLFGGIAGAATGVFIVLVLAIGLVYVIALSVVGGIIGAYLADR